ncbi:hypothetical protein [Candidatus Burkholderia verschuerenii]|uniref:hypothetical protein n=1 Tax=Candidatus Burkholderia verschuerenii TaxID=242163 RepID=UPI0012EE706C|nr:hypothetical protein [Candidatus Burkholderia verschuerenii]
MLDQAEDGNRPSACFQKSARSLTGLPKNDVIARKTGANGPKRGRYVCVYRKKWLKS